MANPVVAVLTIAGVVGTGATLAAVSTPSANVAQEPVVVTVEGEPIIVDGGVITTTVKKPNPGGNAPVNGDGVSVQKPVVQTAPVAQNAPVVEAAPVVPAPVVNTNTGASGYGHEEGEEEDEDEVEYEVESHEEEHAEEED